MLTGLVVCLDPIPEVAHSTGRLWWMAGMNDRARKPAARRGLRD